MTHETAIHRADAELALGHEPRFAADLAADGVSEFLENLWEARAWRRGMGALRGDGQTLQFVATDVEERWKVVRTADGFRWTHHTGSRSARAEVTVWAPASDLYLLLWKRLRPDRPGLRVRGQAGELGHWLRHSSV